MLIKYPADQTRGINERKFCAARNLRLKHVFMVEWEDFSDVLHGRATYRIGTCTPDYNLPLELVYHRLRDGDGILYIVKFFIKPVHRVVPRVMPTITEDEEDVMEIDVLRQNCRIRMISLNSSPATPSTALVPDLPLIDEDAEEEEAVAVDVPREIPNENV